jgi:hypothetical protein
VLTLCIYLKRCTLLPLSGGAMLLLLIVAIAGTCFVLVSSFRMLQRQQASAIIAARQTIVEGAVSIVQMALDQLSERKVVELDPERRAAMVSNLLVVLCGERSPQPVVDAGTLYS